MDSQEVLDDVLDKMNQLAPSEEDAPMPASLALAQLKQKTVNSQPTFWQQFKKEIVTMLKVRKAIAPILALFVIGLFIASPAVRAAASDFLGNFRVQKFAPISISPQQLALLEELAESGLTPGQFEMIEEPGEPKFYDGIYSAERETNLNLRQPSVLGNPSEGVFISDGGAGKLTIDLEGARAILSATGADPKLLPDSLDKQDVTVEINESVGMSWGSDNLTLIQTQTPLVQYPADVDPVALGTALLQVLGMNADEANRLAESIDWTSTLIFPIPEDAARFEEVTVNGVSGLALTSLDEAHSALLWQENGVVYLLNGDISIRELNRIGNSIR